MSPEKFLIPAREVIAERQRRAESDAVLANVIGEIPAVVRAEMLSVVQETPAPVEDGTPRPLPYEMQAGEPRFVPFHDPRPLTPPGIPAPEVAPSASYPKLPPQTL